MERMRANVESLRTLNMEQKQMEPIDRVNRTEMVRIREVQDQYARLHCALAKVWNLSGGPKSHYLALSGHYRS
jgi:hypothetical protein